MNEQQQKTVGSAMSYLTGIMSTATYEEWVELEKRVHARVLSQMRTTRHNNRRILTAGDTVVTHSLPKSRDKGNRNGIVCKVIRVSWGYNEVEVEVVDRKYSRFENGEKLTLPLEGIKLLAEGETVTVVETPVDDFEQETREVASLHAFLGE